MNLVLPQRDNLDTHTDERDENVYATLAELKTVGMGRLGVALRSTGSAALPNKSPCIARCRGFLLPWTQGGDLQADYLLPVINLMHVGQIDQRGQHFGLEPRTGFVMTITTAQNQLLQIFHAVLVAPEHVDGFANAGVVVVDDGHLAVDARLHGNLMQRHRPGFNVLFLEIDGREPDFFGVSHFL